MKLGTVIGRVTLNRTIPGLAGARWLVVTPFTHDHYRAGAGGPVRMGTEPSLVVYDNLGAGVSQTIGYVEGREAAQPLDPPPPIDAISAALIDELFYKPSEP